MDKVKVTIEIERRYFTAILDEAERYGRTVSGLIEHAVGVYATDIIRIVTQLGQAADDEEYESDLDFIKLYVITKPTRPEPRD